MTLEPGFVPPGWERGDPLRIMNGDFSAGEMAAVSRNLVSYGDFVDNSCLEFAISFHYSERHRVVAWMKWWNE